MAQNDIRGTVTDEQGNVIPNARVYLFRMVNPQSVVSTTADGNGEYVFTEHPDGTGNPQQWFVAAEYTDGGGTQYNVLGQPCVQSPVQPPIPDSVISRFTLDNADTDGTTVVDSIGSNDGTIQNPDLVTTGATGSDIYSSGEAYEFGNDSGYITLPDSLRSILETGDEFTVTCLVYPTDLSGDRDAISIASNAGSKNFELRYDQITNEWFFVIGDQKRGGLIYAEASTPTPATNDWFLLAARVNRPNSTMSISVNGNNFVTTNTDGGNASFGNESLKIGTSFFRSGLNRKWQGKIDDVRFYNKSLTNTEINNLYNTGRIFD